MELFCRTEAAPFDAKDFAADLAALEWALVEVLHAGTAPPLSPRSAPARHPSWSMPPAPCSRRWSAGW